jgi:hypothetical protein
MPRDINHDACRMVACRLVRARATILPLPLAMLRLTTWLALEGGRRNASLGGGAHALLFGYVSVAGAARGGLACPSPRVTVGDGFSLRLIPPSARRSGAQSC